MRVPLYRGARDTRESRGRLTFPHDGAVNGLPENKASLPRARPGAAARRDGDVPGQPGPGREPCQGVGGHGQPCEEAGSALDGLQPVGRFVQGRLRRPAAQRSTFPARPARPHGSAVAGPGGTGYLLPPLRQGALHPGRDRPAVRQQRSGGQTGQPDPRHRHPGGPLSPPRVRSPQRPVLTARPSPPRARTAGLSPARAEGAVRLQRAGRYRRGRRRRTDGCSGKATSKWKPPSPTERRSVRSTVSGSS